jgi:hypothetical protein
MKLRDDLAWHRLSDDTVVLDLRTSSHFRLNGPGAFLWELLTRDAPREELVVELAQHYGIGRERAAADVDEFVASVKAKGLFEE